MDNGRKLELLQQQIDEANAGRPGDFSLWRQRTDVTLRTVLGDANPLYESFTEINYGLSIWTTHTPDSAWEQAQAGAVRQAISILEAAKLEVELSGGSPQPAKGVRDRGQSVFVVHGHDDATRLLRRDQVLVVSTQAGATDDEDFPGWAAVLEPGGKVAAELTDWREGTLIVDV